VDEPIQFLVRHGYTVLFVGVLVEQIGLPVPAVPFLLAAGALAGSGELSFVLATTVGVVAALLSDALWFELGRSRGSRVLNLLCRISLEPDSCVKRTENAFIRYGVRSLLIAKFIPGLSTVAPPLAGIFRIRVPRFLLYDTLGAILWVGSFAALGYLFSDQLGQVAARAAQLGALLVLILAGALAAYIAYKYVQRQRILHRLRVARITAEELRQKLESGEEVMIVDLRQQLDLQAAPSRIPGALRMAMEELEKRHQEIPRDRDIVLYCS
jgi:membrane protein DedA with SNARE-associated domain